MWRNACFGLVRFRRSLNVQRGKSGDTSIISSQSKKLNATMKNLISSGQLNEALDLFDRQLPLHTDATLTLALKASAKLCDQQRGIRIHQQLSSTSLQNPFIQTTLIHFYMQCHLVDDAQRIFSAAKTKSVFMCGVMLKGYLANNMPEKVIEFYEQTPMDVNEVIIIMLFNACGKLCSAHSIKLGKNVLKKLPKSFLEHQQLINAAISMLMKFGEVNDAERLFEQVKNKSIVTYGAMMQEYVKNSLFEKALDLFEEIPMERNGIVHIIVYNACASLCNDRAVTLGTKVYEAMPKEFLKDIAVISSIIHMMMRLNQVEKAESLFKQMSKPDLHSYGIMINGYKNNEQPRKCLALFEEMKKQEMKINEPIASALAGACAQLGIRSISEKVVRQMSHLRHDLQLKNSLIDMWGKSSAMNHAEQIFQSISQPDVFTYNTMINGYGRNGMGYEAIEIYEQMPEKMRNDISHTCVLNACSHSGLVTQARTIFNRISTRDAHIVTTMVDCLSRMGIFDEAHKLIVDYEKTNPPSVVMYMALLSGARNHRQLALSQQVYDRMKGLFAEKRNNLIAASVLVSHTYLSAGDEQKSNEMRQSRMKQFGKNIRAGVTWTEVNGELLEFHAHDRSHPRSSEAYAELEILSAEMKERGHQYDSTWITRPLKDGETIESVLCGHSEKLAIAYHLIQRPRPSFIQVTKNLRVCGDCHSATKLIAQIRQCEIIVRDANRIHHFSVNGQCSCQDHF